MEDKYPRYEDFNRRCEIRADELLDRRPTPAPELQAAICQASWDLYFSGNPVCEIPDFVNHPGVNPDNILDEIPRLILSPESPKTATKSASTGRRQPGAMMMNRFEEKIRELTRPINGQLPRPWMTAMTNPREAEVFIVGRNQRKGYPSRDISHQRHLDSLFNRNGESCRGLYDSVTNGRPPPTRRNTDRLVCRLNRRNIHNILETNVICYSTRMSADLRMSAHDGGAGKGEEIFRFLLDKITPAVLIVHGVGSVKQVSNILSVPQLKVPKSADEISEVQTERHLVILIPSLAPPEFNRWSSWSDAYLENVADRVRDKLAG